MNKLAQCLALGVIVVVASLVWVEPIGRHAIGTRLRDSHTTLAQRYPLRARSNNFYNRSKISYTRGKR